MLLGSFFLFFFPFYIGKQPPGMSCSMSCSVSCSLCQGRLPAGFKESRRCWEHDGTGALRGLREVWELSQRSGSSPRCCPAFGIDQGLREACGKLELCPSPVIPRACGSVCSCSCNLTGVLMDLDVFWGCFFVLFAAIN